MEQIAKSSVFRVLLVVTLLSGCSTAPTETRYVVEGTHVASPPENATVVASTDQRIRDLTAVQEVVREATPNETVTVRVNQSEYERTTRRLERLPLYNYTTEHQHYDVLYVRSDEKFVRVRAYRNILA